MDPIAFQGQPNARETPQNVSLYMAMVSVVVDTNAGAGLVIEGQIMCEGHIWARS